jgi:hemerythrin superfamily protein
MAIAEPAAGQKDALAFLMEDHAAVEKLFVLYQGLPATGAASRKGQLVERMIRELRLHAAMEEQSFYPSVREVVAGGDQLVDEGLEEHLEAKELLTELEGLTPDDPGFEAKVETLIRDVRHHVHEEEHDVLPRLRNAVGQSWLDELGRELDRTKQRLKAEGGASGPAEVRPLRPVLTSAGPSSARRSGNRSAGARRGGAGGKSSSRAGTSRQTGRSSTSRGGRTRVVYHVSPRPDGRWAVAKKGSTRPSSVHDTKSNAVARGKELARKQPLGQLVVHTADGRIQNEFTYGADPRRSPG